MILHDVNGERQSANSNHLCTAQLSGKARKIGSKRLLYRIKEMAAMGRK